MIVLGHDQDLRVVGGRRGGAEMLECILSEAAFPSAEPLPSGRHRAVEISHAHNQGDTAVSISQARTLELGETRNSPRSHSRYAAESGLGHRSVCTDLP